MKHPLVHLPHRAASLGVLSTYLAFGDGNLRFWDWQHAATLTQGDTLAALKLLLLQGRIARRDAERLFSRPVVSALLKSGIARLGRNDLTLGKAVLLNYHHRAFFVELCPDPGATFAEDAQAIIASLPSLDYQRCLSLYSGCGIETLVLNHQPEREVVFAVPEADPRFLQANWSLNGIEASIRVTKAKRLNARERFDLVLARFPSSSLPDALASALPKPGGVDGLAEIRRGFELIGGRLETEGTACFTCILYGGDTIGSRWESLTQLAEAQGLNLRAVCTSKQVLEPGIPLFNQQLGELEHRTGRPVRELMEQLVNHYCDQRFSHAYFVRGTATLGSGRDHGLLDLSDRYYGNWSI